MLPYSGGVPSNAETVALGLCNTDDGSSFGYVPRDWDGAVAFKMEPVSAAVAQKYTISKSVGTLKRGGKTVLKISRKVGQRPTATDALRLSCVRIKSTEPVNEYTFTMPFAMAPLVTIFVVKLLPPKNVVSASEKQRLRKSGQAKQSAPDLAQSLDTDIAKPDSD